MLTSTLCSSKTVSSTADTPLLQLCLCPWLNSRETSCWDNLQWYIVRLTVIVVELFRPHAVLNHLWGQTDIFVFIYSFIYQWAEGINVSPSLPSCLFGLLYIGMQHILCIRLCIWNSQFLLAKCLNIMSWIEWLIINSYG